MWGETTVLFDSDPTFSVEARSHCTLGYIDIHQMNNFFIKFPKIKQKMIQEVISNPYDHDRERFVHLCRKNIDLFSDLNRDDLRQLFYHSRYKFLNPDEMLF